MYGLFFFKEMYSVLFTVEGEVVSEKFKPEYPEPEAEIGEPEIPEAETEEPEPGDSNTFEEISYAEPEPNWKAAKDIWG